MRGDIGSKYGSKEERQPQGYLGKNVLAKGNNEVKVLPQDRDCLACWRASHKASVAEAEHVNGESSGEAA